MSPYSSHKYHNARRVNKFSLNFIILVTNWIISTKPLFLGKVNYRRSNATEYDNISEPSREWRQTFLKNLENLDNFFTK